MKRLWQSQEHYGLLFKKRATGELPEMESSKAIAKLLKGSILKNYRVLDAGCGSGHYLRSLINAGICDFSYTGCDITKKYIQFAKKVNWENNNKINILFENKDLENLSYDNDSFDVTYCSNVILHLKNPSKALYNLSRVTKKKLFLRTLIGKKNYIIKELNNTTKNFKKDYDLELNNKFCYYNIFSIEQIKYWMQQAKKKYKLVFFRDEDFSIKNINQSREFPQNLNVNTNIIQNKQFNGPLLLDWHFIVINFQN
jgi:ubiquinone/menaquinone biosynthesis C-methylase UbiE